MSNFRRAQVEEGEFPILCESCMGDNPYVKMYKVPYGRECKVCERPFTIYRWKAGKGGRFRETEICQSCTRKKGLCQSCLLDLKYGVPVQVNDELQKQSSHRPVKTYLSKLARAEPYYRKNKPEICTFYLKGECKRGSECPYRHEIPEAGELAQRYNVKDRYFGRNDPVAEKMLEVIKEEDVLVIKSPSTSANVTEEKEKLSEIEVIQRIHTERPSAPPGVAQKKIRTKTNTSVDKHTRVVAAGKSTQEEEKSSPLKPPSIKPPPGLSEKHESQFKYKSMDPMYLEDVYDD